MYYGLCKKMVLAKALIALTLLGLIFVSVSDGKEICNSTCWTDMNGTQHCSTYCW